VRLVLVPSLTWLDSLEKRLAACTMTASSSESEAGSRDCAHATLGSVNTDTWVTGEAKAAPDSCPDPACGANPSDSVITPAFWPVSLPSPREFIFCDSRSSISHPGSSVSTRERTNSKQRRDIL
jgi:hypothetical protein